MEFVLMDAVKTYDHVNREDSTLHFGISRMEDIYRKHQGKPDVPHRHAFFTVVFTIHARGKHFLDFQEYALQPHQIYFIPPGQVHQIIEEEPSSGFAMVFSEQFLISSHIPQAFLDDLNLFSEFGKNPPLELHGEHYEKISGYFEEIYQLFHGANVQYRDEAIGSFLKLILIRCNNVCTLPRSAFGEHNSVLRQFKSLVDQHYRSLHGTSDYAAQLHMTGDHLNRIVKTHTGKTAKEHIQSRIIVEAKRLLYFTDLSAKEIGYELGFSEPANFSAFFKKSVGLSPSHFKAGA